MLPAMLLRAERHTAPPRHRPGTSRRSSGQRSARRAAARICRSGPL
jgi:hypothetical protein